MNRIRILAQYHEKIVRQAFKLLWYNYYIVHDILDQSARELFEYGRIIDSTEVWDFHPPLWNIHRVLSIFIVIEDTIWYFVQIIAVFIVFLSVEL